MAVLVFKIYVQVYKRKVCLYEKPLLTLNHEQYFYTSNCDFLWPAGSDIFLNILIKGKCLPELIRF